LNGVCRDGGYCQTKACLTSRSRNRNEAGRIERVSCRRAHSHKSTGEVVLRPPCWGGSQSHISFGQVTTYVTAGGRGNTAKLVWCPGVCFRKVSTGMFSIV
ncbi:unnamed protein product, partial [Ectocarpus sp. 4 AP-2014]